MLSAEQKRSEMSMEQTFPLTLEARAPPPRAPEGAEHPMKYPFIQLLCGGNLSAVLSRMAGWFRCGGSRAVGRCSGGSGAAFAELSSQGAGFSSAAGGLCWNTLSCGSQQRTAARRDLRKKQTPCPKPRASHPSPLTVFFLPFPPSPSKFVMPKNV